MENAKFAYIRLFNKAQAENSSEAIQKEQLLATGVKDKTFIMRFSRVAV